MGRPLGRLDLYNPHLPMGELGISAGEFRYTAESPQFQAVAAVQGIGRDGGRTSGDLKFRLGTIPLRLLDDV